MQKATAAMGIIRLLDSPLLGCGQAELLALKQGVRGTAARDGNFPVLIIVLFCQPEESWHGTPRNGSQKTG